MRKLFLGVLATLTLCGVSTPAMAGWGDVSTAYTETARSSDLANPAKTTASPPGNAYGAFPGNWYTTPSKFEANTTSSIDLIRVDGNIEIRQPGLTDWVQTASAAYGCDFEKQVIYTGSKPNTYAGGWGKLTLICTTTVQIGTPGSSPYTFSWARDGAGNTHSGTQPSSQPTPETFHVEPPSNTDVDVDSICAGSHSSYTSHSDGDVSKTAHASYSHTVTNVP